MSDCERCGQALTDQALTCPACGQLTAAGRQAQTGDQGDDDEIWRQSVAAARQRQRERPMLDPEAVLQQVVASSGTEAERQRASRGELAHDDRRTDCPRLRQAAKAMGTLGLLLASVMLVAGMMLLVAMMVLGQGEMAYTMVGSAAAILWGGMGIGAYFLLRYWAETLTAVAQAADDSRRSVLLLRELISRYETVPRAAPEHRDNQSNRDTSS
jgi:hypothetical protein